jgi:hypothetical protein
MFYELREELIIVFESERANLLSDETLCNEAACLPDTSQASNPLLTRVCREQNKNILTCTDKINSLKEPESKTEQS